MYAVPTGLPLPALTPASAASTNAHKTHFLADWTPRKLQEAKPICMRNLLALLLFVPSLCHAQVPDYVAVEDLIAWYSFNGNADDSGPGSHNGILHNTSFTSDRHGELNGALEFNGSNSYVSVAHDVNLNLSGSEFTLSVWVNHHGFDEWDQNLVVKSDGPGSAPSKWLFWHKANVNAPSGLGFASNQMMLGGVEQVST